MIAVQFGRFGGPEVLEIVEIAEPHPGAAEIRIRVRAAGVNASDWKKRQGLLDQQLPQTLGYEAAGVVDEVGADVDGVAVGDRVFGASPYGAAQAQLAVLSAWAPIPDTLDDARSAAIPVAAETAARALNQLGVSADSVRSSTARPAAWAAPQSNWLYSAGHGFSVPAVRRRTTFFAV